MTRFFFLNLHWILVLDFLCFKTGIKRVKILKYLPALSIDDFQNRRVDMMAKKKNWCYWLHMYIQGFCKIRSLEKVKALGLSFSCFTLIKDVYAKNNYPNLRISKSYFSETIVLDHVSKQAFKLCHFFS